AMGTVDPAGAVTTYRPFATAAVPGPTAPTGHWPAPALKVVSTIVVLPVVPGPLAARARPSAYTATTPMMAADSIAAVRELRILLIERDLRVVGLPRSFPCLALPMGAPGPRREGRVIGSRDMCLLPIDPDRKLVAVDPQHQDVHPGGLDQRAGPAEEEEGGCPTLPPGSP